MSLGVPKTPTLAFSTSRNLFARFDSTSSRRGIWSSRLATAGLIAYVAFHFGNNIYSSPAPTTNTTTPASKESNCDHCGPSQKPTVAVQKFPTTKGDQPELTVEYAVKMNCNGCLKAVQKVLDADELVREYTIDLPEQRVTATGTMSALQLAENIQKTGKKTVIRGTGSLGAGVCILATKKGDVHGVVRLIQANKDQMVLDGSLSGLAPGLYSVSINELGDVTDGSQSTGQILANVTKAETKDGTLQFRLGHSKTQIWDIIGRSMVVHNVQNEDPEADCYGIIARSAGLFELQKKICTCDGLTLWDDPTSK
eukprot:NODE_1151_length_984_cov_23.971995_g1106_i0.p1 GENE.NODE_1151_length_984_cov_23.971995_g1106_i0~~NODE_1151_length_984_cov_23.971995_g1106_i0.p1  ORF type:complete len:320 (+),score=49.10 NODE_1151_length_984_cov_23.971995_g1106_i0:30-962(+)